MFDEEGTQLAGEEWSKDGFSTAGCIYHGSGVISGHGQQSCEGKGVRGVRVSVKTPQSHMT